MNSRTRRWLPEQPGVYLYFNANGDTIYVGKARSLRDRVRSYLGAYGSGPKTDALPTTSSASEFIVTDWLSRRSRSRTTSSSSAAPVQHPAARRSELPYLQLTTTEAFPRVLVARAWNATGTSTLARSCLRGSPARPWG